MRIDTTHVLSLNDRGRPYSKQIHQGKRIQVSIAGTKENHELYRRFGCQTSAANKFIALVACKPREFSPHNERNKIKTNTHIACGNVGICILSGRIRLSRKIFWQNRRPNA
jgi:hypothetical protein